MFTIDGVTWDVPCQITRVSEIKSSEISGFMLDKSYFNDVMATYLTYTISLAIPFGREDVYYLLYEILNNPVDGHTFVLPYNGEEITVTARIDKVSDAFSPYINGKHFWRSVSFVCETNNPVKDNTLGEVIQRGRAPLPPVSAPSIGDTYTYTADGWVKVEE